DFSSSNPSQLIDILDTNQPDVVIDEVSSILTLLYDDPDILFITTVFHDVVKLYNGKYPGFQACTTDYHDLTHTLDAFLAMARLIHGYSIQKGPLEEREVLISLISALMHDTGYIKATDDPSGTGAKYTLVHISRSVDFMKKYCLEHSYLPADCNFSSQCILCTDINTDISRIPFETDNQRILGKILGISDLIGQMADRNYLEKLFLLYIEFEEGDVQGFDNSIDLLQKTVGFFDFTKMRFSKHLDNLDQYMIFHFIERWNVHEDLYLKSINKNAKYLKQLMTTHPESAHEFLRREGIIDDLIKSGRISPTFR
ncbi:hypothetical protein ACFL47_10685, partial [Candidatus Latescibacterota bacterium]